MKKLTLILFALCLITSCTYVEEAKTEVDCPCKITQITFNGGVYEVRATSIKNSYEYFTFKTTLPHQIGDKIE